MRNPIGILIVLVMALFSSFWSIPQCRASSFFNDRASASYATLEEIDSALRTLQLYSSAYNSYLTQARTLCRPHHYYPPQEISFQSLSKHERRIYRLCTDIYENIAVNANHLHEVRSTIHDKRLINRIQYHSSDIALFRSALKLSRRLGVKEVERKCIERINHLLDEQ